MIFYTLKSVYFCDFSVIDQFFLKASGYSRELPWIFKFENLFDHLL